MEMRRARIHLGSYICKRLNIAMLAPSRIVTTTTLIPVYSLFVSLRAPSSSPTMATNTSQDDAIQHQTHQEHVASDHLHDILSSDASRGAAVHSFTPAASPQAKAAATSEEVDKTITRAATDAEPTNARGVLFCTPLVSWPTPLLHSELPVATGNGHNILPTINVSDAGEATKEKLEPRTPLPPTTPGDYPPGLVPVVPDWYKVGWRAAANIDAPPPEEGEEKDKSILGLFLHEQFYGAWYHNAALIFFVRFTLFVLYFVSRPGRLYLRLTS